MKKFFLVTLAFTFALFTLPINATNTECCSTSLLNIEHCSFSLSNIELDSTVLLKWFDSSNEEKKTVKKAKTELKTVVFATNLHCAKCVQKVEENIAFEKGVKDLKVELESNTITITYDTKKTTEEKLAQAISKLGYKVVVK